MRFFEFKLPEPGTDFANAVEAELNQLSDIVDQKPEIKDKINSQLQKIINAAKSAATEPPAKPVATPVGQPPAEETKETMFDEAASTMSMTDSLVNTLMQELENVIDATKKKAILSMVKNLVSEAKKEEFQTGKGVSENLKKSARSLAAKISGTLEALSQQYQEQLAEGDPQAPKRNAPKESELNQDLIDLIEGIFNKPISRAETPQSRDETAKKILSFMNRCQTGVVDLKALVAKGSGNVLEDISGDDKQILDMLENALMKAKPGKTAGNWGPGELGLAILGTPVNKASKGDLDVGGEMIELKASQDPKKGGRFGSTALQRGTDGKSEYIEALGELLTKAGYKTRALFDKSSANYVGNYKNKKGEVKSVSHLNFGQKFISICLNPRLKNKVSQEDTLNFLEMVSISCITKDYKTKISTRSRFKDCSNPDGTINIDKFNLKYAELLYELYQKTDGVGKIMVLNPITGSFYVLGGPKDLAGSPIVFSTSTIDFNDSQGKASPQIGIQ